MFSIIGDAIVGKKALSLFSGAGSLGIEALSRGAAHVIFVDNQDLAVSVLRKNIAALNLGEKVAEVYQMDADQAISRLHKGGHFFDFIFMDPPYYQGLIKKTLMNLEGSDILTRFSYLVFEHSKEEPVVESPWFSVVASRSFGQTQVTICQKSG